MNKPSYRGRFAPSPTGDLHFGSLVAAMASYLDARSRQGEWLVRVEDLDPPRTIPGSADSILRTLEALGFRWDGDILYQSTQTEQYTAAADALLKSGQAYFCACSRKQVQAVAQNGVDGPVYPGTCRDLGLGDAPGHALRVRTLPASLSFHDRILGTLSLDMEKDLGDFVVRRADGLFAYQLAVVVDDAAQDICHVVRGEDLLFSTPRQIHLQRLLGLPTPEYAHIPLVLDEQGRKLSKTDRAHPVSVHDPVDTLLRAHAFLRQPTPEERPSGVEGFWRWAIHHWDMHRIRRAAHV